MDSTMTATTNSYPIIGVKSMLGKINNVSQVMSLHSVFAFIAANTSKIITLQNRLSPFIVQVPLFIHYFFIKLCTLVASRHKVAKLFTSLCVIVPLLLNSLRTFTTWYIIFFKVTSNLPRAFTNLFADLSKAQVFFPVKPMEFFFAKLSQSIFTSKLLPASIRTTFNFFLGRIEFSFAYNTSFNHSNI